MSVLSIAAASLLAIQSPAAVDSAESILARAAEAYKDVVTLQAEFTQRIEIPALERTKEGRGVVYQKKPDYFLMKFSEPEGDVVVADGEFFWIYYPSAQPDQVIRTSMANRPKGATLGGQFVRDPSERYVATYVRTEELQGRPARLLSLVPRFGAPYTLVRVWIDSQDHLVRRFEVHEENQTVRTVTLHNLRTGVRLADSLFRFTPPPGVEVFAR